MRWVIRGGIHIVADQVYTYLERKNPDLSFGAHKIHPTLSAPEQRIYAVSTIPGLSLLPPGPGIRVRYSVQ